MEYCKACFFEASRAHARQCTECRTSTLGAFLHIVHNFGFGAVCAFGAFFPGAVKDGDGIKLSRFALGAFNDFWLGRFFIII